MPASPRDAVNGLAVPVDPWDGQPLSQVKLARIARLKEASEAFRGVLHDLDGTTFGAQPGDPRMALAFVKLDEALLWAVAAILDHGR